MRMQHSLAGPRMATLGGLLIGATGIAILWASGVPFPIYPPPGIILLLVGALFIGLAPWRWAPVVGVVLGLFIVAGFLISPAGVSNLTGGAGMSVALGQGIQMIGVLIALIAGVIAVRAQYRKPMDA